MWVVLPVITWQTIWAVVQPTYFQFFPVPAKRLRLQGVDVVRRHDGIDECD